MKNLSLVSGIKELDRINQYALKALSQEERQFIEKMNKVVEGYEDGRGKIFGFNEQVKIQMLWQKYAHLKPFQFRFDPKEKTPVVLKDQIAFIIWTAWKSRHLVSGQDNIEEGSLAAARVLSQVKEPLPRHIPKHTKLATVVEFMQYLHISYPSDVEHELAFWEENIFPYLEGKWEFKWEIVQKCFYCSNDAIAICNSCSPTSSTGLTPEKPLCEDCIVNGIGINIVKWLMPRHEGESKIEYAFRKLKSKK